MKSARAVREKVRQKRGKGAPIGGDAPVVARDECSVARGRERDAWSMVLKKSEATSDYPSTPPP